jgi:hypothetical protein
MFLILLPLGVQLDRLGHKFIADGLQMRHQLAAFARKPDTTIGRFDQVFLSFSHDISVKLPRAYVVFSQSINVSIWISVMHAAWNSIGAALPAA